jgi:hypothetical protein
MVEDDEVELEGKSVNAEGDDDQTQNPSDPVPDVGALYITRMSLLSGR